MNEKINILNIELYQTSAKAAMQKVVQYMESDSINTVEIITMDMLLKGKEKACISCGTVRNRAFRDGIRDPGT